MERKPPQDTESRHADKYIVRFPDGMRDELKAAAKASGRTLNAEIIARLLSTFGATGSGTAVIRLGAAGSDVASDAPQAAELQLVTQQQLDELAQKAAEAAAESALRRVFQVQGIPPTAKFGTPGLVQGPPPEPDKLIEK